MPFRLLPLLIAGLFASGAALAQNTATNNPGAAAPSAAAPSAPAATPARTTHHPRLDTNQDGQLSRDEAAKSPRLSQRFDAIDSNRDGQLSRDELRSDHRARQEQRKAAFAAKFKTADSDGDGVLSKAEAEAARLDWVNRNFEKIDANHDGKVSLDEMRARMTRHGKHRHGMHHNRAAFDAKFKAADGDGDGALSKAEADAARLDWVSTNFERIDADHNGKVTRDELRTDRRNQRAQHQATQRSQSPQPSQPR